MRKVKIKQELTREERVGQDTINGFSLSFTKKLLKKLKYLSKKGLLLNDYPGYGVYSYTEITKVIVIHLSDQLKLREFSTCGSADSKRLLDPVVSLISTTEQFISIFE